MLHAQLRCHIQLPRLLLSDQQLSMQPLDGGATGGHFHSYNYLQRLKLLLA